MKKTLQRICFCLVLVLCLSACSVLGTAAAETPQISYEFSTDIPGRADGLISVTNLSSVGKSFSLHWGTSEGILSKKSATVATGSKMIGTVTLKYILRPFSSIPAGATHLWLSSGGKLITSYEVPKERRLSAEEPLYRFGVISDIHIGRNFAGQYLEDAMRFFRENKASFVISAGDNTNNGTENHWRDFAGYVDSYDLPFWFVFGNHDALAWNLIPTPEESLAFCKKYFPDYANENHSYGEEFDVTVSEENPNYDYSFTYRGDLYLFMGVGAASNSNNDQNIDQRLSQSQIDWLDQMLADHYKKPVPGKVFFTCHYATNESELSLSGIDSDSSAKLHEVLNRYPGVICFTGHVHYGFETEKSVYVEDYAVFQLPTLLSNNGFLVEVYRDYVILQGFDASKGAIDFVTYLVPNKFTDRVPDYGISLRVADEGDVYWQSNVGESSWQKLTSLSELQTDGTVQSLPYYEEDTVDFRTNETHLQWKLSVEDDSAWADLVALEELLGNGTTDVTSDSESSSSSDGGEVTTDVSSDSGNASSNADRDSVGNSDANGSSGISSSDDGSNGDSNQGIMLWLILGAGVVVLCGGVAVALVLLKKKKKN